MGGQFALWLGDESRAVCDTKKPQPFTAAAGFRSCSLSLVSEQEKDDEDDRR